MNDRKKAIDVENLQFFGKISASISHELKNAFAVIGENAGLLEDFSVMAERGAALDPSRLMALAGTIRKHIRRVDGIVNRMNRFAHSADQPVTPVDLGQMMDLLVSLAERFARLKEVTIEMTDMGSVVRIRTRPFVLENLVWRCVDFAMDAVGADKRLVVDTRPAADGALIRLARLEGLGTEGLKPFPSETDTVLANQLGADLGIHPDTGEIVIALPGDIVDRIER